ncbi:zinc finger MYM-type protein 1-like [Salvia splendens]|uniref:zinc finger MYM-type protein 1-like n=1 Tax=Salvia splendens TaxID=180675 RepID=UPI001C26959D|nr:zinc finger MYM-type protein 1-like [Salvia splendens]
MEKYFGKRPRILDSCPELEAQNAEENLMENDINESEIKADPGLRKPIAEYGVNIRDRIRREYVAKGPCQPKGNIFQKTRQGKDNRSFRDAWYKDYDWLEYSEAKHVAYCFYCFLFKRGYVAPGDEAFTSCGFSNWKKALEKFKAHVGDKSSAHHKARIEYENFVNQRGHDESSTSLNKGNFLELLEWYGLRNDEVGKVILKNAPGNNQMTSPSVQKDMANACAVETTLDILGELGDKHFSILVDESRDCSTKEQMAIVIRFVNKDGQIIEMFLALVHVKKTSSVCLKEAIDFVFAKFKLSLSRLRGQGYDGASNMRGECNGLKALILKENPSTCYLISIATTCGSSCKRADMIRQIEHDRLVEMIENGEIGTGRGQNQETSLKRPGDTRWGSHYVTVIRLANMWQSVTEVLENVLVDGEEYETRGKAGM